MTQFVYTVFGLGVDAEMPLPTLVPGATQTDVVIRWGTVSRCPDSSEDTREFVVRASPEEVCFQLPTGVACLVKQGREIIVEAEAHVSPNLLCHVVSGMPLAMLMHQRGHLILHASAVAMGDRVVAFLGHSGQGKSTTAGSLHQRGHSLITDDILALDLSSRQPIMVLPSYPQMRLLPASVQSLGSSPDSLPRIFPTGDKRSRQLETGFHGTPLPLRGIYVLTDGDRHQITPMSASQAFLAVTEQSYPPQSLLQATHTATQKFQQTTTLVQQVPVYRLERPRNLEALTTLAQFIEHHVTEAPAVDDV